MLLTLASLLLAASPARPAEVALLVAAEVTIAADAWQTLDLKRHRDLHELNPLLGEHPTDAVILCWASYAALLTAALWLALPAPWRDAVTLSILFVEAPVVARNAYLGLRWRLP